MTRSFRFSMLAIWTFAMVCIAVPASAVELPLPINDIQRNEPIDFASEILPILQRNCLACHHEKEAEGGLVLETLASIRKGGDSGEGVVAKDLESSQIFIRASGIEEPLMPPEDNKVGATTVDAGRARIVEALDSARCLGIGCNAQRKYSMATDPGVDSNGLRHGHHARWNTGGHRASEPNRSGRSGQRCRSRPSGRSQLAGGRSRRL